MYDVRPVLPEDAPALVDLFAALAEGDGTSEHYSLEDVEQEMSSALIDPRRDWVVAQRGTRIVGTSFLLPRAPADGRHAVGILGGVHPDHRRVGLGTRLLGRMVARAQEYVAEHSGARPDVHVQGLTDDTDLASLLSLLGLEVDHWTYEMQADLRAVAPPEDPPLPEGYTLSTWEGVDGEEIRPVHNTCFAEHRSWSPWSPEMWQEYIEDNRSHRPAASLVAREAGTGRLVSYLHASEFDALTAATGRRELSILKVGTLPELRRRGLASALIGIAFARGVREGYETAALEVDAHNETGALGLYERLGFTVARRWTLYGQVF